MSRHSNAALSSLIDDPTVDKMQRHACHLFPSSQQHQHKIAVQNIEMTSASLFRACIAEGHRYRAEDYICGDIRAPLLGMATVLGAR